MTDEQIMNRLTRPTITKEMAEKLGKKLLPEQIEIKPDGSVYISSNTVRDILNDSFGLGQWAVYKNSPVQEENCIMVYGELWVFGCFIGSAIGEHSAGSMSYGNKIESASSDLITKLVKYLGIASELWDKSYREKFISEYCQNLWVINESKTKKEGREISEKIWIKKGDVINYPYKLKTNIAWYQADNSIHQDIKDGHEVTERSLEYAKENSALVKNAGFSVVDKAGHRIWRKK